ncbi:hypothetical protein P152DRAFT_469418 [Eremomyces bilateralis CBS 781.70]|uniref:Uncharacterized protein n=1 Tax=Eremomyces bilateralis CBS 781.70 TaxID=1392243 RepID=A0A6G1GFM2_9PEZI|nr:uncharacterized protein P152DRAFT_469418 [Eremomyces bilateralis CBS 781.70]KAF1816905.1 hypothetical protein P152DRAFT_469418 [Eremomyces bilateralis CBS 781.70]
MSGNSKVGDRTVYEAGDQRNYKNSEIRDAARYHEWKPNSNLKNDSNAERSISNRMAREDARKGEKAPKDLDSERTQMNSTLPARAHGNEPSRGAQIDQSLREEEEDELRRKG